MIRLSPPRFEGTVRLPDGRSLGYAEFGPVSGRPLLWFHGTPGACRQIAPQTREACWRRQIRLICVERPGIGASTSHAYEAIADFARDIESLVRAVGVDEFSVVGLSGGGPYALACAHELGDRVGGVVLLGGVAPSVGEEAASGGAASIAPLAGPLLGALRRPLGAGMWALVAAMRPVADEATDLFCRFMPLGDARILGEPMTRLMFHDDMIHGGRAQMEAILHDVRLFGLPWGFSLRNIQTPVHLLYGDADNIVPHGHGEHMAALLPRATFCRRPGEGHLGGLGATDEIFDALFGVTDRVRRVD